MAPAAAAQLHLEHPADGGARRAELVTASPTKGVHATLQRTRAQGYLLGGNPSAPGKLYPADDDGKGASALAPWVRLWDPSQI